MNREDKEDLYINYIDRLQDVEEDSDNIKLLIRSLESLRYSIGVQDKELKELKDEILNNINQSLWNGMPIQTKIKSFISKTDSRLALLVEERVNLLLCIFGVLDELKERKILVEGEDVEEEDIRKREELDRTSYVFRNDIKSYITELGGNDFNQGMKKLGNAKHSNGFNCFNNFK